MTAIGVRRILSGAKDDVAANGVSECVDGARRLGGTRVGMHTHVAEVVTETRLEEGARCWVEWLSRRAQDIVNDLWQFVLCLECRSQICLRARSRTLKFRAVFTALVTLAAARAVTTAGTLALQMKRVLHRRLWRRCLNSLNWCSNFTHR